MEFDPAVSALVDTLTDTGIWLAIKDNALRAGPTALIEKHPELVTRIREHKAALLAILQSTLAHALFGAKDDDPRFEADTCPECQQQVYVITKPRRLAVHRLPGGKAVCPGSDRAQHVVADMLMQSFYEDRCLTDRPGALLTWTALRGALGAWCLERDVLLPPPAYLWAWLDARHTRSGMTDQPAWQGLSLILEEWFGEDEAPEVTMQQTPYQAATKVVLRA